MIKIKVNQDISPKTFLMLIIFSLILFLILGGYTINIFIKTRDYVKVYASITEVSRRDYATKGGSSTVDNYANYIKLRYTYNNGRYTNEQRVLFRFNKKEGDKIKIYVNPKNPMEVRDNYMTRVGIAFSLMIIFFNIFCIKAYQIRKKENIEKI